MIQWRNRYGAGGISALGDLDRSGRPPVIDDVAVVVATVRPRPSAAGGFDCRRHLGLPPITVPELGPATAGRTTRLGVG